MAVSASIFSSLGGSVSDLFGGIGAISQANLKAQGLDIQAQGDLAEATNYDAAAVLAGQNAQFTQSSTAIKQAQIDRQTTLAIGGQQADVAAGGFSSTGSALDLMRDSASQGALTKAVAGQQGLITEAGYQEQQKSYQTMSDAARATASGLEDIANQTRNSGTITGIGDFISGAIKGVGAIASIALAPETGGASLALGGLFMGGGSPTGYGSG
jgi:hypothetical protein